MHRWRPVDHSRGVARTCHDKYLRLVGQQAIVDTSLVDTSLVDTSTVDTSRISEPLHTSRISVDTSRISESLFTPPTLNQYYISA